MTKEIKTLDSGQKQEVSYCIPLWLRDEQIKQSIQRVKGRIQPSYEPRKEKCAVVCFGPSLNDTWEQVKEYPVVISCSGSHKFLVEHGVIPTYHVEVDPRPHKVKLIGPPQPDTTYLIASTCASAVFDHLSGNNVLLWHVFDAKEEGFRVLPHGEWALTGGCDVGSRALTIAGFLGFRDVHVFGMDGSFGDSGRHAAEHPNGGTNYALTTYGGKEYRTTPAMLEAARQVWHELNQMPKVHATFHGEGLVQAMARDYKPKYKKGALAGAVGVIKQPLISAEYLALNAELHRTNLAYGVGGGRHADTVLKIAKGFSSILDYGCGKSLLAKEIPFPIWEYDPAIPGKDHSPRPAEVVVCTDVLEHIEPEHLKAVLLDLKRVTQKVGYFVIHTGPSTKTLSDGRNSHLIQEGKRWWEQQLRKYFQIGHIFEKGPLLYCVVGPTGAPSPQQEK